MLYKLKLQTSKDDRKYKQELERRLQKNHEASIDTQQQSIRETQVRKELNFDRELIQPCECNEKWHRICIREKITKDMRTSCKKCQFQYTAAYTDCYALFNDKRKNYLGYMLWQESIFFVAFLLLAGFTSFVVYDAVRRGIPFMRT